MSDSCFELEGWDEFVERFSQFVDKWEAKKAQLLKKMGNIYHSEVIPHVPVDTSHLVSNIFVFGEGIPHDYVEVGTNVELSLIHIFRVSAIIYCTMYCLRKDG